MTAVWVLLVAGCGLVIITIPLTVIIVIWTGRAQWNHDSWLLVPLGTAVLAVVCLSGAALGALQMVA